MTAALSISSFDSSSHNQQQNCLQIYLTPNIYRFLILYPSHTSCPCVCWAPDPRPFYTVSLPGDISFVHSRYYPYSLLTVLKEKCFSWNQTSNNTNDIFSVQDNKINTHNYAKLSIQLKYTGNHFPQLLGLNITYTKGGIHHMGTPLW